MEDTTQMISSETTADRRQAEKNLSFQAELLANVFDALTATDENFRITYWNEAAQKLFGWTPNEVIGKHSKDIFQTKFPNSSREKSIDQMLRDGLYEGELYYKRKDGSYVLTHVRSKVLRGQNGEFKGTVTTSTDITERKKAEELLTATNDRLSQELAILSKLHEASVRLVRQDSLPGLLQEFLNTATELMHSDMGSIHVVDVDGNMRNLVHRGFDRPYPNFFTTVTPHSHVLCRAVKEKMKRVIVEDVKTSPIFVGTPALKVQLDANVRACQSTPLISRSGALVGVITTHYRTPYTPNGSDLRFLDLLARQVADLIEHVKHERELHVYAKNLESLVNARTKELEQALESEKRSSREAILLQDILTHDIRNYNHVLKLGADLLAEELKGNVQVEAIVQSQLSALDAMTGLLEKAKKLGKVVSEKEPTLKPVDLIHSIQFTIDIARKESGSRMIKHQLKIVPDGTGGSVETKEESRHPTVIADELLSDVFLNLYSNSLKHTNDEEDEVLIETKIERAVLSDQSNSVKERSYWKVSISDNGRGIPNNVKESVFSRYYCNARGTGLGLSIVHALVVERYKGSIKVKDRIPGDYTKGTLVEIYLPKALPK